ncbi:MAG: CDP-alcohol phosphatidyltransferase family protein [Candidatus Thorarchaeota archaeon]
MSPSKYRVRRIFRWLMQPIGERLAGVGVRPDTVTYVSLQLALLGFVLFLLTLNQWLYALFVFLVGLLDGIDGVVARSSDRATPMGALTDSIIDKVSEIMLLLALVLGFPDQTILGVGVPIWGMLCISGWLLTSYSRSRAEALGVKDLDVGLGARSERLFTLIVFSLFFQVLWGLVVVTFMGIFTAAYRFYHYKRELADLNHQV